MMNGFHKPGTLYGMPVIRNGDNVFIINNIPNEQDWKIQAERMELCFHEYSCPFSLLDEFNEWFEWHKRKHVDKQSTAAIILRMVNDIDRIKLHKIEKRLAIWTRMDFGISMSNYDPTLLTAD